MRNITKSSRAILWIAAVALIAVIVAYANRPGTQPAPLSTTELAMVGSWTYFVQESGTSHLIHFHSDRTCDFDGSELKYPSRWRIDGTQLVFQHKYQTVIGPMPIPIPAAVKNFELPSFMARKEESRRPLSLSPDGLTMTFGAISGVSPACVLTRAEGEDSTIHETEAGRPRDR